ncbi:MAG: zinc ribbon domain-containing protein [Terriglobia bacterium]
MLLVVCAALAIGAILYTFWVKPEPRVLPTPAERERAFLNERKQVVYENLRDLQMEYRMGKLSEKDYRQLKEHHQEQLAGLLYALDQLRARSGQAGEPVAVQSRPGQCPQCGEQNPPGNHFCGACGTRLEPRTGFST